MPASEPSANESSANESSANAPWTVGRLLQWTTDYLKGHGSESPRLDAEVLLAEALGRQRIELYTTFDETPSEKDRTAFRELVRRRAEGMPVAYLVGRKEFYSLSFQVTPDVLIPRPETELLVVAALDLAKTYSTKEPVRSPHEQGPPSALQIADVGTGSGVIAICLAKHCPGCRVTAVDRSAAALAVATENAQRHGVADRIDFIESDLFAAVPAERRFDVIASNPPYVKASEWDALPKDVRDFEPRMALVAGSRGTELIERLVAEASGRLRPGGHLLIEIGPAIHAAARQLLESDAHFDLGPTIKDLARLPRVLQAGRLGGT
jgi:release factor glutamine methyltransferase